MNVNRATDNPGGMECEDCGVIFVGSLTHALCNLCHAKMLLARPENADLEKRVRELESMINKLLAFSTPSYDRPEAAEVYCEGFKMIFGEYPAAWAKLKAQRCSTVDGETK